MPLLGLSKDRWIILICHSKYNYRFVMLMLLNYNRYDTFDNKHRYNKHLNKNNIEIYVF